MQEGSISFAMDEFFKPNKQNIEYMIETAKLGRGIQIHAKVDEDNLAAFLVGAGFRAYFGIGGWSSASAAGNSFGHWDPIFGEPLGAPHGDAVLSASGVYTRQFGAANISVTFDTNANKGTIVGWGKFPPPSPTPPHPHPHPHPTPPKPSPPSPPSPPVQPTASCPVVKTNCGYRDADVAAVNTSTWGDCCAACSTNKACEKWAWTERNYPKACHMHAATAHEDDGNGYVCGSKGV